VFPNRVEIEELPIKVIELSSYKFRGHLFAYRIQFIIETLHEDGTRAEMASESAKFFIDIDGSGRFTVMMAPNSLRELWAPPIVPDWVRSR
jgi:hypothetical protein